MGICPQSSLLHSCHILADGDQHSCRGLRLVSIFKTFFLATIRAKTSFSRASSVKQNKNTSETVAQLCPRAAGTEADLSAECGNLGGRTQGKEVCHTLNISGFQ